MSLSADGKTVAIGAFGNSGNGANAGHVRVYEYNSTTRSWTQLGGDIDGEAAGDSSGSFVSLSADGKIVAIGATGNDGNGANAGHVRVYEYNSTTRSWTQLGADIDGEAAGDHSGWSVSLSADGKRVAIGVRGNDGNGANAGHVRVYETPFAITSSATASVQENAMDFSYTATASWNATFSLTGTRNDNGKFTIDGTSGEIKFISVADYENPADANTDNVYNIQVTATSSGEGTAKTATKDIAITVTNVVEVPVFSSAAIASVQENTPIATVAYTASVSDASTKDALTFSLATPASGSSADDDNDKFDITSSGVLTFKAVPDFENPGSVANSNVYKVQITATATDGTVTETTTKDVTITVTNVVETPVFTSGATAIVAENTTGTGITATGYMAVATEATATFSLAAGVKDNDLFEITSGALSFKTAPDFENPRDVYSSTTPPLATAGDNIYEIEITATAGTGATAQSTTKNVWIMVTDVDEIAPNITSALTVSVPENKTDFVYTITANEAATFTLGTAGGDEALFKLEGAKVSFKAAPDFEMPKDSNKDNVYKLELKATDAAGNEVKNVLSITVTDVDEIAPNITSPLALSVPENKTDFVYTITANEAATFALGTAGGDEALFKLEGAKLSFKAAPDFEMPKDSNKDNVYKLELKATDAAGNEVKNVLSITVTDVAEQATIVLPEALTFADTKVGQTVSKALTISNPSAVALKVTAIEYPAGFSGDWPSGEIAAGAEQAVNLSFKPTEVKSYTGTVTVASDAGSGRTTLSVSGKGILITTIEPQSIFPGLNVFPNPAEDVLHVKLPSQTRPVTLQLVDVNGQVVYEQEAITSDELSIDVSGYKSGVYVLVLESGGKVEKRKVVISNQ